MLDRAEFEQVRREICASGPPSVGDDLLGMEVDVAEFLSEQRATDARPLPWRYVSLRRAEGEPWLIAAKAEGERADAFRIDAELSRIWSHQLAYQYRQRYTVVVASDEVRLYGVTQIGPGNFWVTVKVQVALN